MFRTQQAKMKRLRCKWRKKQVNRWRQNYWTKILLLVLVAEAVYILQVYDWVTPIQIVQKGETIEMHWSTYEQELEDIVGIRIHLDEKSIEFYRVYEWYEKNPKD